ncbi:hypothetical protein GCM10010191_44460 [Actinomadura vinacea]|uniref:ESAT-6-like protein n=1 Tax=Actinomadura vinacea TaxID=115336 RepID=A0ABP5WGG4_9ACTN
MGDQSAQDLEGMRQAAQRIERSMGVIKGLRGRLESQKGQMMTGWEGPAARNFDSLSNDYLGRLNDVSQRLNAIHGKLTENMKDYERSEQQQQEEVGKIASIINH